MTDRPISLSTSGPPETVLDAEPSDALAAEISAFCRANLSHVKCPRSVEFIAEMPRGDNGKLYKKVLRAPYWEKTPA